MSIGKPTINTEEKPHLPHNFFNITSRLDHTASFVARNALQTSSTINNDIKRSRDNAQAELTDEQSHSPKIKVKTQKVAFPATIQPGESPPGQATLTFLNGDILVGRILEGMDGKTYSAGTLTKANGDICVGEFVDHQLNGVGSVTKPSGEKRFGSFLNDEFVSGYASSICTESGISQEGFWENGQFNGDGYLKTPDSAYLGQFVDGKFKEGMILSLKGIRFTQGKPAAPATNDDTLHLVTTRSSPNISCIGHIWEGLDGKVHFTGVYQLNDGNILEGHFAGGIKMNGVGRMTRKNSAEKCFGLFVEGRCQKGYSKKLSWEGFLENNTPHG
jgi:hypothetical protein